MATPEEVARDLLGSIATDAGLPLAVKWISNRYAQLVNRVRFKHLRKVGELSLPDVVDTGTVTTTRDSTAVSGDSTTFETDVASDVDKHFLRASSAWYRLSSVTDETNLVLASGFAEDAVTDGAYKIVQRHHALNTSARWIGSFVHTRLRRPIDLISPEELDIIAPGRVHIGLPLLVAQKGFDVTNGLMIVEVYPPPEESEILHYVYWELPSTLSITSTIPEVIDPFVLKEGAYIDACRFEMSMSLRKGNIEQAAVWRNESRAQETKWKTIMMDAVRADRGADDISFILQLARGKPGEARDYRTAHDIVASRTWE